jgi:radical SAM superfamily enzyme YgiQ (UPF0313 family)
LELPRRSRGDELLPPGALLGLRERLRRQSREHDLTTVIACAFDHRTRMLPFVFADLRMAPAGVRAVGAAMADAGFHKTRIVQQQWNKYFRPSRMQLDGRVPDLFLVSSMQIHTTACKELIRDARRIDRAHRPLIIAGGPKAIYEPWDVLVDDTQPAADLAVTGEEFVLLSVLEVLLSIRAPGGSMLEAFEMARNSGLLDSIPGLVYPRVDERGNPREFIDTGVQRLVGNLDELPDPVHGFRMLEPPSSSAELASRPLPAEKVRRHSPIASLVLTFGCKFNCPYCPIPAYNQRQHRVKSGARLAEEFSRIYGEFGIRYFFGADDNFFNDKARTLDIVETLARTHITVAGKPLRKIIRWGTEVTVHDTLMLREHLPLVRSAGVRALWLGVEDMTATFVKKGQSVDKTTEAFLALKRHGICPMPMMMHHDSQPLWTSHGPYGLLNQARLLRKAGAVSLQVLMMTPATGSKLYESAFTSGMAYDSVGGRRVEPHMLDGNYVVASEHPRPAIKQFNIMLVYLYFYNPIRFLWALVRPRSSLYLADAGMQVIGMVGLLHTIRRTLGWGLRLLKGKVVRRLVPPCNALPMAGVDGGVSSHALPGAAGPARAQLTIAGKPS